MPAVAGKGYAMIRYAVSLRSLCRFVTPAVADALRKSPIRNVEIPVSVLFDGNEQENALSRDLLCQLISEKAITPCSVHLPYYGQSLCWDPSALDEDERKAVVKRFTDTIGSCVDFMPRNMTLHASNEPPMGEHPARVEQAHKTVLDLMPLAQRYGFSLNVEYLPRTCIGNCVAELQAIIRDTDPEHVGICLDVNHVMGKYRELPEIIAELAPRIRVFHISDFDGINECHWFAGQGVIDWPPVMAAVRAIPQDITLISETSLQLGQGNRALDPNLVLRNTRDAFWFLKNCDRIIADRVEFQKILDSTNCVEI